MSTMANSKTPADTEPTDAEHTEEVTGYGYLTDAEREEAIAAHAKAVAENDQA